MKLQLYMEWPEIQRYERGEQAYAYSIPLSKNGKWIGVVVPLTDVVGEPIKQPTVHATEFELVKKL